ncbi:SGNH/GDSL hydrolase family protein [Geodermatophilus sp. SYSU D00758]
MTPRVVALGDSTSCGEGVGLRVPRALTWPVRLAAALPGAELTCAAVPGARLRDVRAGQLAPALAAHPQVATVLAGLNDVSRGGLDPAAVEADLAAVVADLTGAGATVVLGRLHDPTRSLPLPAAVRSAVLRRVAVVNAAVDRCARRPGVLVLDLAAVPGVAVRRAWDVDRLHPTAELHGRIARAAALLLAGAGHRVDVPPAGPLPARAPGPVRELRWAARHGLPWLAGNLRGVAAALTEPGGGPCGSGRLRDPAGLPGPRRGAERGRAPAPAGLGDAAGAGPGLPCGPGQVGDGGHGVLLAGR